MIYQLFHDKKNSKLEVKPLKDMFKNPRLDNLPVGNVVTYNDHYYFISGKRCAYEKGNEIRQSWINEYKEKINILNEIKL